MAVIRVLVDVQVLNHGVRSYPIFEANLRHAYSALKSIGHSLEFSYFVRPTDVVIKDENKGSVVWGELPKALYHLRIQTSPGVFITGTELLNYSDLEAKITAFQQQDEICLVVSPEDEICAFAREWNCEVLPVTGLGEFRCDEDLELNPEDRVVVFQDTDDTTLLLWEVFAKGRCEFNKCLVEFYKVILERYAREKIYVQQITSRTNPGDAKQVFSSGEAEPIQQIYPEDPVKIQRTKQFINAQRMPRVLENLSALCASLQISCAAEAIYASAICEVVPLKIVAIYYVLNDLKQKGGSLPGQVFLLDDDPGQLDLNAPVIQEYREKIRGLGVKINLVQATAAGIWNDNDLVAVYQALQIRLLDQEQEQPRKRRRVDSQNVSPDRESSPAFSTGSLDSEVVNALQRCSFFNVARDKSEQQSSSPSLN